MNDCVFCAIIANQLPHKKIYEDDQVIVIEDISPKAPIHYLIIPKVHVKDLTSLGKEQLHLAQAIANAAQQIASKNPDAADFRLLINNGYNAGQRVFHLHAHFLAGRIAGEEL